MERQLENAPIQNSPQGRHWYPTYVRLVVATAVATIA
jgi:hypothetical protein